MHAECMQCSMHGHKHWAVQLFNQPSVSGLTTSTACCPLWQPPTGRACVHHAVSAPGKGVGAVLPFLLAPGTPEANVLHAPAWLSLGFDHDWLAKYDGCMQAVNFQVCPLIASACKLLKIQAHM